MPTTPRQQMRFIMLNLLLLANLVFGAILLTRKPSLELPTQATQAPVAEVHPPEAEPADTAVAMVSATEEPVPAPAAVDEPLFQPAEAEPAPHNEVVSASPEPAPAPVVETALPADVDPPVTFFGIPIN